MALTVNTNIASLNTQRNINNSSNALTTWVSLLKKMELSKPTTPNLMTH